MDLLQKMQSGRAVMSDDRELAASLLRDFDQVPDAEACSKLANALNAVYTFSRNLGKLAKNKQSRLERRANDWGDIMQFYYLCDESMHFLTFDEKYRNQTQGSPQQKRILLYKDLIERIAGVK